MTPLAASTESADAISRIGSFFMLNPATYTRGAELGFPGMTFYVAGRGGALGPVDADVVSAAFVFFNPVAVREAWESALEVLPPAESVAAFSTCASEWAQRWPDDLDAERLAELAGRLISGANPAGAPLFAAWRLVPEPEPAEVKALAVHRMNVLRELRGALHGAAVLAAGLSPLEAVMANAPHSARIFGWTEDLPDSDNLKARHEEANLTTDAMFAPVFAVLTEAERTEFVALANAALAATI